MKRFFLAAACALWAIPSASAEVFRVVPNASGDAFPAIAQAIADAQQSEDLYNIIEFEAGDYYISKSVRLRHWTADADVPQSERYGLLGDGKRIEFRGAGMDLTRISVPVDNHAANPMFVFDGVDRCGLADLTLDGQVRSFDGNDWRGRHSQCGVFVFGAQRCRMERVRFQNLGRSDTSTTTDPIPGGANVLVACVEHDEADGDYLPDQVVNRGVLRDSTGAIVSPGIGRSCYATKILDCDFVDDPTPGRPIPCSNFAIRMITNWKSTKYHAPHRHQHTALSARVSESTIQGCKFRGGFYWNAVELGGHGTVFNDILECDFTDCIQTPADVDKAASFNLLQDNNIENTYSRSLETRAARVEPGDSLGTWTFAMRMQGYPGLEEGRTGREAIGNSFIRNKIKGVFGNTRATGAILISRTVDALIQDNEILSLPRWVAEEDQNYRAPEDAAAGIKLGEWVRNVQLNNNLFPRSKVPSGSRKSSFVAIMELPDDSPAVVQLSDLPTLGNALTGDQRHIDLNIVEYEEGEAGGNSMFTWTISPPATSTNTSTSMNNQ